jgi:hypothetical protein
LLVLLLLSGCATAGQRDDVADPAATDARVEGVEASADAGSSGISDAAAPNDGASNTGPASVTGSVGGYSIAPAYSFAETLSGDMFVIVSSDGSSQCGLADEPNTRSIGMQTIGSVDGGWIGSWSSGGAAGGGLIVSFHVGEFCQTEFYEVGTGTLEIVATLPTIRGMFTASFDGGTFAGTFDAPPSCVASVPVPTCEGG